VVIVNYNTWQDVSNLVASLTSAPEVLNGLAEILVVDNASSTPPPRALLDPAPGVRLILRDENGGFAVGVNTGWRASRGDWLLLLNSDVAAEANLLGKVVERVRRLSEATVGVVGFGLLNGDGTRQPSVGRFPNLLGSVREQLIPRSRRKYQAIWRTQPGPVDWVTGACMLVNKRLLDALGGLDEEFFLYYEEVALCRSASRLGWTVNYDPSIEVVHLRPLQNRALTSALRVITRHSKLLYFRKHLPRWQFRVLGLAVALEARGRGVWSRIWRKDDETRSWKTIVQVERAMRKGNGPVGREVAELAVAVSRAGDRDPSPSTPAMRTEARRSTPLPPRKDGTACRRH
jgi:GT2 family glycosyltransferase